MYLKMEEKKYVILTAYSKFKPTIRALYAYCRGNGGILLCSRDCDVDFFV